MVDGEREKREKVCSRISIRNKTAGLREGREEVEIECEQK